MNSTASIDLSVEKRLPYRERPYFDFPSGYWKTPLLFMLCLAATGLCFYPALVGVLIMLFKAFRDDRYEFLIMSTLLMGGFGMISKAGTFIDLGDFALVSGLLVWLFIRKPPYLRKILIGIVLYIGIYVYLATLSIESMSVQLLILRTYAVIVFLIVPVAVFSGKEFDIHVLWRKLMPYVFIMSAFYLLDALIFSGNLLVPCTYANGAQSTFYSLYWRPFSGIVMRKYPPGMFIVFLVAFPLIRYYRLRMWQWALILLGVLSTQTFTFISALIVAFVLFQGSWRKTVAVVVLAVAGVGILYGVDCLLPERSDDTGQSLLRIRSSFDQFADLWSAVDDEDLAEFGSGRLAQTLPKVDLVQRNHKELTGLGFLHPEYSKINQYMIENEYYSDVSKSYELATGVEIAAVQIFLHVGWIGLIVHVLFFLALYLIIRKFKYSSYFLCMLFFNVWLGFGGFATLYSYQGLIMCSFVYGTVLISNRDVIGLGIPEKRNLQPMSRIQGI
ncbi:MAG: hypothetical protein K2I69_04935 [Muribaculaceae bacterium]|nr:hypothetical protein [Muribaculaceae bacterium]